MSTIYYTSKGLILKTINIKRINNNSNSKHIACYEEMNAVEYACMEVCNEKVKWDSPCDCNH